MDFMDCDLPCDTPMKETASAKEQPKTQDIPEGFAYRETGRTALIQEAERLERLARNLRRFEQFIPQALDSQADEGLWELMMRARRR